MKQAEGKLAGPVAQHDAVDEGAHTGLLVGVELIDRPGGARRRLGLA